MSVNGATTRLVAGDYEAVVATVGASLLSLRHRGRDLVVPRAEDAFAVAYEGMTLVPWPNRIVGGRYEVDGTELRVPVNEPATGAALHGLGFLQHWEPVDITADRGSWVLDLPVSEGYPFDLVCRVDAVLEETGLTLTVTGTNVGGQPAPFGASTHPYLTCGGEQIDGCTVTVPAASYLEVDEHASPTRLLPVEADLDLRSGTVLGARRIDNAFTDLPAGTWAVELTHPEAGGVRLTSDAPWVQLYTAERLDRVGLAVEPMTCEPDAFNRDLPGVLLAPGDSRSLRLTISAL